MIDKSISNKELKYFKSISELCTALGAPKPKHPLIAFFDHDNLSPEPGLSHVVHDLYMISYKSNLSGKIKYGQGYYDFDEGGLLFVAPNQAIAVMDAQDECTGFSLFFHPDLLAGSPLAKEILQYGFFSYHIDEALHLSEQEKAKLIQLFEEIRDELETAIDETSQALIVSYIAVILNYSNRYYKRQFITRKAAGSPIIARFEENLQRYFEETNGLKQGIPSVKQLSEQLHVSSGYLSDLLRSLTGMNTQQHIHAKLIDLAKQKLSSSQLTAAEIAYELGFEYPQSFNKLFKSKTGLTPLEFREQLN
ncbi:helix-turn-helix domain-containing protein [Sphingobacterium sp. MYb382]|uniref:helix-turn-helix domain-containing protein n=1 Tax=Sphingobacterium sp. MYb382 TaxID=2745278 RepID=UPI0030A67142